MKFLLHLVCVVVTPHVGADFIMGPWRCQATFLHKHMIFCCLGLGETVVQSGLATNKGKTSVKIERVQVYDMDGTIVDSTHRYRTVTINGKTSIDLNYWRANEYRAMADSLLPLAAQYQRDLLDPNCYVIIATARVINRPDARFINKILGCPDYIVSRKHDDSQSGKTLKSNGLARFFNLENFRLADWTFYEDNLDYLNAVCDRFPIKPVFVPSNQGH